MRTYLWGLPVKRIAVLSEDGIVQEVMDEAIAGSGFAAIGTNCTGWPSNSKVFGRISSCGLSDLAQ